MSHLASISEASVSDGVKQLSCLTGCQRSCSSSSARAVAPTAPWSRALQVVPQAAASFPQQQGQSMSAEQHTCVLGQLVPGDAPLGPVPQMTQLTCTQPAHRARGEALVCLLHHSKESHS